MPHGETDHQQRIVATGNEQHTQSHEDAAKPRCKTLRPAPATPAMPNHPPRWVPFPLPGAGTDSDGRTDHPKQGLTGKG